VRAIALGLGAICLLAFVRASLVLARHIPLNWNEGWNAYHTADIAAGRPLYPDPATATFFTNYPPLSFYVIAPIGQALGDHMIAGRLVAFVSLLVWIVLVAIAARRLRCSWASAAFGALVLAAGLFVFSDFYVGVNDPQMLGHALQALGLVLLLSPRRTTGLLAACAVLFAAGVFVKNNLIALPLAAVVWLWFDDPPGARRLIVFGAATAASRGGLSRRAGAGARDERVDSMAVAALLVRSALVRSLHSRRRHRVRPQARRRGALRGHGALLLGRQAE
jgi:hypothetical protein